MEIKIEKQDWLFLLLCFLLGVVTEESFFQDQIGLSYFVFIASFYLLFFWRFRTFSFSHQRLGYLVLISIWILASGYYFNDTTLFQVLNILIIPGLGLFHLVLITSPVKMKWNNKFFLVLVFHRVFNGIRYNAIFTNYFSKIIKQNSNEKSYDVWKKIILGVIISFPVLFVVLYLLISADAQFEKLLGQLPDLFTIRPEYIFRLVVILLFTSVFFGFMQALFYKKVQLLQNEGIAKSLSMDGVIVLTVLILLDLVYVVFVAVQFKYFFSGALEAGYTYAEYARRGFFELLFVTLINLSVTTAVIHLTKSSYGKMKKTIQIALTVLVLSSGVLLTSAFMRMMMYEEAYGFTFTRILAHSFMIFLMVIFAYTLVKVWLEKLSLFHFYFIASLVYYTGINVINFDNIVVERNIHRFEETGKIDIYYLSNLSSTGILALIEFYETNPDTPGLKELLIQRKSEREYINSDTWQSRNLLRDKVYEKLGELDL